LLALDLPQRRAGDGMTRPHTTLPALSDPLAGAGRVHKPRLLDLFSCAGVGAEGYHAAGFEVVGVDKDPQPRYPYEFIQADALDVLTDRAFLAGFDAIHTSPPCQHDTELRHRYERNDHPDLIGPVQQLLADAGVPWVIENVNGARGKLLDPVMLCGRMFPGLRVYRHRYFQVSGFALEQPAHPGHDALCHTFDKRKAHYGKTNEWTDFVQVTGGGNCTRLAAADAMGLNHRYLTKDELNEAIPPAYTQHIGDALMSHLRTEVPAWT
jgi:DNA (cytosine-5)-methyltransferase 1